jgi:tetraacyldisaccharide 4'-kinase
MKSLAHYWYHPNRLLWLLLPLSWLYCLITVIRRKLYRLNLKKSYSTGVPLVVIGNIVAGGSGKTPLLIALCEYIRDMGYKPGVISRGYGGSLSGIKQLTEKDSAEQVGDEPLMIHLRTKVPVVVGADRVAAVDYLVGHNQVDIVLSDDGMQHYRMRRDLEFAVVDAQRRFGNGFCIPAGPLREKVSRLDDVDIVVFNGVNQIEQGSCWYQLKIVSLSKLDGSKSASFSSFSGRPVHAIAGIGFPPRFFEQLKNHGLTIIEHAFSDHHFYQQEDFLGWHKDCIIMTEKDAVKCRHLSLSDAWVVSVQADLSDTLKSRLNSVLMPLLKH